MNPDLIRKALTAVQVPDHQEDLVALKMVKNVHIDGTRVDIEIELTSPTSPAKDQIRSDIENAVRAEAGAIGINDPEIRVSFSASLMQAAPPRDSSADDGNPLPNIRHVIAVGAGKGGVGKSTVAVNLAVGLARMGAATGILDGDIYGPSLTTMLGLERLKGKIDGNTLLPYEAHGIRAMTIGKLVEPEKALIWRGPMAHGAFKQLLTQTEWGTLDYLVVDLPPGTGDVCLSLTQLLPLAGAVIVCTPQKVAQDDARRSIAMFRQLGVPLLGLVENMSYFIGDDGKEYDIFGRGGAQSLAAGLNLPFLGSIPILPRLRANSDAGTPSANFDDADALADALESVTRNIAAQVEQMAQSGIHDQPTLSID